MEENQAESREERMFTLVALYQQGNQTRQSFCEAHDISLSTFGYWQRKYRERHEQKEGFIGLSVTGENSVKAGQLRLEFPGGVTLYLGW
ncbi:TPA: hypothetical protein DCG86_03915 [Candidatus Marinimicrobia bacterium]|nr:hypothetical protein [Candidatus Neomarinimicrobiota bacterium]